MKNYTHLLIAFLLCTFCISCNNRVYNNNVFLSQNSIENKTIAILPAEVILSGKLPKGMTDKEKVMQEQSESKFYQDLLYSEFLDKSKSSKKDKYGVHFINPQEVNNKLSKADFYNNLKEKSNEELATVIGADMIFLVKINKQRILSDGAAIGIDIAEEVLNSVLNPSGGNNNINSANRTHNISFDATLIDGKTGTTIGKFSNLRQATWNAPPDRILRRNYATITRQLSVFALN